MLPGSSFVIFLSFRKAAHQRWRSWKFRGKTELKTVMFGQLIENGERNRGNWKEGLSGLTHVYIQNRLETRDEQQLTKMRLTLVIG